MVNAYDLMPVLAQQLRKVAASRLDKEVSAGNVSYSDVDQRIPRPMGSSGMAKRISRAEGMAPAARTPEQVNRTRTLNNALFKNQHLLSGRDVAIPQVPQTDRLLNSTPNKVVLHNELMLNKGLGTAINDGVAHAYAPNTGGQYLRTGLKPLGSYRAQLGTMSSNLEKNWLLDPTAVDKTLNYVALQHELGEADLAGSRSVTPFASHFGVQPVLREQLALRGDPEAQEIAANVRRKNPDDVLMQRKLREAGSTPDRPLPVEGRASRTLERNIAKQPMQLSRKARTGALGMYAEDVMQQLKIPGSPIRNVTTVPNHVRDAVKDYTRPVVNFEKLMGDPAVSPVDKLLGLIRMHKYTRTAPSIKTLKNYMR